MIGLPALADERVAAAAAAAIAVSGLIVGHGVGPARQLMELEYTDAINPLVHMNPFRPDHRSVGQFVRREREDGDVVVAEDPLVQRWYAGPIDYWFRRYGDMRRYLREQPDGVVRDMYVGSQPLADPAALNSIVSSQQGRVWLITSGETTTLAKIYLSSRQRAWLDSLRRVRDPLMVGQDGVSEAYCLNCLAHDPSSLADSIGRPDR